MKIVSISEDKKIEKRIAITPEITKKYLALGFDVNLIKNYGEHLGFKDKEYSDQGAKILSDEKEIIKSGDIIVQLGLPSDDKLLYVRKNQTLVGVLNPYDNKEKLNNLIKKNINFFLKFLQVTPLVFV